MNKQRSQATTSQFPDSGFGPGKLSATVTDLSTAGLALEAAFADLFAPSPSRPTGSGEGRFYQLTGYQPEALPMRFLAAILEMSAQAGLALYSKPFTEPINHILRRQSEKTKLTITEAAAMAEAIWHQLRGSENQGLATRAVEQMEAILHRIPRHQKTGLLASPTSRSPDGTGDFLFQPSLCFAQACQQIAEVLNQLHRDSQAEFWRETGQQIEKNIRIYFWDKKLGLFRVSHALTGQGDVHGSALSVYRKTATSGQLMTIARQFRKHYPDLVSHGAVHRRLNQPGQTTADRSEPDYTATGWFAYTLDFISPELAEQTVVTAAKTLVAAKPGNQSEANRRQSLPLVEQIESAARLMSAVHEIQARRRVKTLRQQSG